MMQAMMSMHEESRKSNANIARIAASLEKEKLHVQTIQNHNQGGSSTTSDNTKNCNVVTTLQSGKQFENMEPPMQDRSQEEEQQKEEEEFQENGDFEIPEEAVP